MTQSYWAALKTLFTLLIQDQVLRDKMVLGSRSEAKRYHALIIQRTEMVVDTVVVGVLVYKWTWITRNKAKVHGR